MTYRARAVGHKRRTQAKARRHEYWSSVGFMPRPAESVTINGETLKAVGFEVSIEGRGPVVTNHWRTEVIDTRGSE
jgi:hypothetical protein